MKRGYGLNEKGDGYGYRKVGRFGESKMSANNQIVILKKDEKFEVHINSCVDNDFKSSKKTFLKRFNSVLHALRFANEYCNEYPYVEYGVYTHPSCWEKNK